MRAFSPAALAPFAAGLLIAAPVFAACQGESLFECRIGKKELELCHTGSAVNYRFGAPGKHELQINTTLSDLEYQPWPGVGRTIWEAVTFHNATTSYDVWSGFDRQDPDAKLEGGVNVLRGETLIAALDCTKGSVRSGLDLLYGAKEGIGQCWSFDDKVWITGSCD
ncbi:hypothetical protein [Rhodobacter sp. 24-YEA-8]|uniref:hypothetical protein n=1 Tax=Rhodobacter sp. 24-YEA-8 TaxID=1884310 RepID=UPI0008959ECA|nr:hypothetical protein [Rhodobacter sp. 24-YEA-8]SEC10751.1 hypothetical protein SAMN05519105_1962 [Rhodobacter sp. 24-YEA-8]